MANTIISLSEVAAMGLDYLETRASLLGATWRDVVSNEVAMNRGESVVVRTPPSFTASAYNGLSLSVQDITEGTRNVTLNKDYAIPVKFSAREEGASVSDIEQSVVRPAVDALIRRVQTDIYEELHTAFSAASRVFGNATYGNALSLSDVAVARKELNEVDIPDSERYLFISPKDAEALIQLQAFRDMSQSGSATLRTGELGHVYGFDVFESNAISTNTTPDPDETYNLFFHRSSVALAMREVAVSRETPGVEVSSMSHSGLSLTVTRQWDAPSQSTILLFRALYGITVLDTNRGGILRG